MCRPNCVAALITSLITAVSVTHTYLRGERTANKWLWTSPRVPFPSDILPWIPGTGAWSPPRRSASHGTRTAPTRAGSVGPPQAPPVPSLHVREREAETKERRIKLMNIFIRIWKHSVSVGPNKHTKRFIVTQRRYVAHTGTSGERISIKW